MSQVFEEWLVEQRGAPHNRDLATGGALGATLIVAYTAKVPMEGLLLPVVAGSVSLAILGYERVALGESLGNRRWLDALFHTGLMTFFAGLFPMLHAPSWISAIGLCTVATTVYSGLLLPRRWFFATLVALLYPTLIAGELLIPYLTFVSFAIGGGLMANALGHGVVDRSIALWRRDGMNAVQRFVHARQAEGDEALIPLSYDSTERAIDDALQDIRACYPYLEVTYNAVAGDPLTLGGSGALTHLVSAMLRYFACVHGDAPRPTWATVSFEAVDGEHRATLSVEGDRLFERPEQAARFGAAGAETQLDWDIAHTYAVGLGSELVFETNAAGATRMAIVFQCSPSIVESEEDEIEDPKAGVLEASLLKG